VFDLLRRDEDDLTEVPLTQRKQLLMRLVGRDFPGLHPVHAFEDGAKLLEAAERYGLEGIVRSGEVTSRWMAMSLSDRGAPPRRGSRRR
jgi:ATP-dependent DNA ligase